MTADVPLVQTETSEPRPGRSEPPRSCSCRSTAAASCRWWRSCPAWRCRRARAFPRLNGGRPRVNEYLFDGISVLQPEPGTVPFMPVIDAIQEFKVVTNSPPAEFGRFNGGVINLTHASRAATQLHGAGLRVPPPRGAERAQPRSRRHGRDPDKPVFRRNQFGFVLGGPIAQDRDVLLRRLPGHAPEHRPRPHLDRARPRCSARASSRRRSAAACRRSTIRRRRARRRAAARRDPFRGQHDPREPHRPGGRGAPRPLSAAEPARHRQQLPRASRNESDRPGSVRRRASTIAHQCRRPAVRALQLLPRPHRSR